MFGYLGFIGIESCSLLYDFFSLLFHSMTWSCWEIFLGMMKEGSQVTFSLHYDVNIKVEKSKWLLSTSSFTVYILKGHLS